MPRQVYYCAISGCGFSTEDPKALQVCSKCHLARYCCRDHQVTHWKKAHKVDCFQAEDHANNVMYLADFHVNTRSTSRVSPKKAHQLAKAALNGKKGVAVFIEANSDADLNKIVTDAWSTEEQDDGLDEGTPPDLYLPHVPPALFRKAEAACVANPNMLGPNAALHEQQFRRFGSGENKDIVRAIANSTALKFAVKSLFETTGEKRKDCMDAVLEHLKPIDLGEDYAPVPSSVREEADSLVGKVFSLEGGIEMMYITPPVICFAALTRSQADWINGSNSTRGHFEHPILVSPVTAYNCKKEGWMNLRIKSRSQIAYSHDMTSAYAGTAFEKDANCLKISIAAAEFGDVTALCSFFTSAQSFAVTQRLEHLLVPAAHKLLKRLCEIHPNPAREETSFLHFIGQLHESRATWLMKEANGQDAADQELLLAAKCYHSAAMKTHQFSPSTFVRFSQYHALGVTMNRLGNLELAKRALLWAMTDPCAWLNWTAKNSMIVHLFNWWDYQHISEKERTKAKKRDLKKQRAYVKEGSLSASYYGGICQRCDKSLQLTRNSEMRCARCLVSYCSTECQTLDWPDHKVICSAKKMTFDASSFSKIGTCTDATREVLANCAWPELTSTVSLTDAYKKNDEWHRTRPTENKIYVASWISDAVEQLQAEAAEKADEAANGNS